MDAASYDRNPLHHAVPSEFSWQNFLDAARTHQYVDESNTVYLTTLVYDGEVLATGTLGHKGEYLQSIGLMIRLSGKATDYIAEASRYAITFELQDGDPYRDTYDLFARADLPPAMDQPEGDVSAAGLDAPAPEADATQPTTPAVRDAAATVGPTPDAEACQRSEAAQPTPSVPTIDLTGEEEQAKDATGRIAGILDQNIDDSLWMKTCSFFNHDPAVRDTVRILGAEQTLLGYQAVSVYRYFLLITHRDPNYRQLGAIFALAMGLGKTRIYQAIALVRTQALAFFGAWRKLRDEGDAGRMDRLHGGDKPACEQGRREGQIPCPHRRSSLTRAIAEQTEAAGALVIVPACLVMEALSSARAFFARSFTISISEEEFEFPGMKVVSWDEKLRVSEDEDRLWKLGLGSPDWRDDTAVSLPDDYQGKTFDQRTLERHIGKIGEKLAFSAPEDLDGIPASCLFLVASRNMTQRTTSWDARWRVKVELLTESEEPVFFNLTNATCFAFIVHDEVHKIRGTNARQATVSFDSIFQQMNPPRWALMSGTPMSHGLVDLTFCLSLLRGIWTQKTGADSWNNADGEDEIGELRARLRGYDSELQGERQPSQSALKRIARTLRGYFYRNDSSHFLGHPVSEKPPCTPRLVECPVDEEFRPALASLTRKAGTALQKKMQEAMANDQEFTPAMLGNFLSNDTDFRDVRLATQFPGYALVLAQGHTVTTTKDALPPGPTGKQPRQYADHLPAEMQPHARLILRDCSRNREMKNICYLALRDPTSCGNVAGPYNNYDGPKNIVILTEFPTPSVLVKAWAETELDQNLFKSTMIEARMSKESRQEAYDWFAEFREEDGSFKKYSKILVSTYELCGTGLDCLKAANYLILHAVTGDFSRLEQAVGRIDRRGQPLPTYVFHLQSTDQAADAVLAQIRDGRGQQLGKDGILAQVAVLAGVSS